MSTSIWDWWFGDGQLQLPMVGHMDVMRVDRWLYSTGRRLTRRRLGVFLAAIGVVVSGTSSNAWADESRVDFAGPNANENVVSPTTFAMIIADEDASGKSAASDSNATDAVEALDEDALRRKRLRDLLGEEPDPLDMENYEDDGENANREPRASDFEDDEDEDAFAKPFIEERLPEIESGHFVLPPIRAVSIDQEPIGNGRVPEGLRAGKDLPLVALPEDGYSRMALTGGGAWPRLIRPWAAPNTYSHPLYFEDRMLERHGHERWGCFQPLAAGARFFTTFPMLPYLATVQEPCDIVYSKGYYRAGSPVPKMYQRPPLEKRAVLVEAAVVSGTFIALP
ncbi:hypothetical protein [Rhodopirellula sallentina]|nr:hypothetical protein [Rhodopirellula sallentina]